MSTFKLKNLAITKRLSNFAEENDESCIFNY